MYLSDASSNVWQLPTASHIALTSLRSYTVHPASSSSFLVISKLPAVYYGKGIRFQPLKHNATYIMTYLFNYVKQKYKKLIQKYFG